MRTALAASAWEALFKIRPVLLREEIPGGFRNVRNRAGAGGVRALKHRILQNDRFPEACGVGELFFVLFFAGVGIALKGERQNGGNAFGFRPGELLPKLLFNGRREFGRERFGKERRYVGLEGARRDVGGNRKERKEKKDEERNERRSSFSGFQKKKQDVGKAAHGLNSEKK